MFALAEFREMHERYRKQIGRMAIVALGCTFGLGFLVAEFEEALTSWLTTLFNNQEIGSNLATGLFFLVIGGPIVWLLVRCVINDRRTRLRCPECKKSLLKLNEAPSVIASRACPHCKARIIDDSNYDAPNNSPIDTSQVEDWKALVKWHRPGLALLLIFAFMMLSFAFLAIREDILLRILGWCWIATGGNVGATELLFWLIVLGIPVSPAMLVCFALWRRTSCDSRLRCPHCGKCMFDKAHLVTETQNCYHCGHRVLHVGPAACNDNR
jgi:hypothetical protein